MEKLIFIVIGFILGQLPGWFDRKRKIRTYFAALRAETHVIKEKSERYLKDNVISPLFRLPTESFKTSYPILLVEGVLKEKEIHDLSLFYSQGPDGRIKRNEKGGRMRSPDVTCPSAARRRRRPSLRVRSSTCQSRVQFRSRRRVRGRRRSGTAVSFPGRPSRRRRPPTA